MKRTWWIAACLAVLVLQAGCHPTEKTPSGNLRILNAVVDAEPLDVLVDDSVKSTAVTLGATGSSFDVTTGARDIKIRSSTTGAQLLDKSISLAASAQTLVLYGHRSAISTTVLTDDTTAPSSGKFKARVVNLSPEAGAVDTYLTAGDITSTAATVSGVAAPGASDYVEASSGSARITFASYGTTDILFQSPARDFAAGSKVTLIVFPSAGGKLVNGVVLTAGGDGVLIPNPSARVKAVNAMADSTLLNFKGDGTTLLSNVPFTASSTYVTTATGARVLQIEPANVPGSVMASTSKTLDPARDYSAIAVGSTIQPAVLVLADENYVPTAGTARLRFANALDSSASVDALVNFASQATGIAPRSASTYYTLTPSDSYNLTFATSGGVSVLAALTPVELVAGGVYTAYLLGSPVAPQARLVRDR